MPRLFAAVEIPDDIKRVLGALRAPLPGARWVEPENLHLTLYFAGDIDHRAASELDDSLANIDAPVFRLHLGGLGVFGGAAPSVIWAGVEPTPELDALMRAAERAARAAGLAKAKRASKPHVTIARLRHARPEAVARFLESRAAFRSRPFTVGRFVLMSSKPFSGGGPYAVEADYPLQGAGLEQISRADGS